MTVPVLIQTDGEFSASLVGAPEFRCTRPSKDEAMAALQRELAKKSSQVSWSIWSFRPWGYRD